MAAEASQVLRRPGTVGGNAPSAFSARARSFLHRCASGVWRQAASSPNVTTNPVRSGPEKSAAVGGSPQASQMRSGSMWDRFARPQRERMRRRRRCCAASEVTPRPVWQKGTCCARGRRCPINGCYVNQGPTRSDRHSDPADHRDRVAACRTRDRRRRPALVGPGDRGRAGQR